MSLWTKSAMVIKSTEPIKSHPKVVKADRIRVTIELDINYYHQLRAQIEAPDALRGRRTEDPKTEQAVPNGTGSVHPG